MNITKNHIDELNAVVTIKITKEDYEPKVEKTLKEYRRKANINGFRPGSAPMPFVKKMYGKAVLLDEINKLLSDGLHNYIVEEKLDILGEPLPNESEQKEIDFDSQTEFEFAFDLGLSPKVEIEINKSVTLPFYNINIDEKIINDQKERYAKYYGTYIETDEVSENSLITCNLEQLNENGETFENGLKVENTTILVSSIKDEIEKAKLLGAKNGLNVRYDVVKSTQNNTELSSLLRIGKEEAEAITSEFMLTINEIKNFQASEINQDLFNKIYGEGNVNSMEEFEEKIKDEYKRTFVKESDFKFFIDAKQYFLDNAKFELPVSFLKRWLITGQNKLTPQQVENEFAAFEKDMKWHLIKNNVVKAQEIKVTEEDTFAAVKKNIGEELMRYGYSLNDKMDSVLDNLAVERIKKEEERTRAINRVIEEKVLEHIKSQVTLDEKQVTVDEFNKLFEPVN